MRTLDGRMPPALQCSKIKQSKSNCVSDKDALSVGRRWKEMFCGCRLLKRHLNPNRGRKTMTKHCKGGRRCGAIRRAIAMAGPRPRNTIPSFVFRLQGAFCKTIHRATTTAGLTARSMTHPLSSFASFSRIVVFRIVPSHVVPRITLSCIILSCIVLSCIDLSCIVLSCIVLSCIVLFCIVLFCIVLLHRPLLTSIVLPHELGPGSAAGTIFHNITDCSCLS
jgi:hypothetical protein